jgi:ABC-type Zn uptake system ZnuABC Zn-binding protein ZnuA
MRDFLIGLTAAALTAVAPAAAAMRVVATTTDVAALAAVIGGDLVGVETIAPAAVDPEAFEPRPSDIDKVRHADLLVRVGLGYDYWLDKLVAQIGDKALMRGGEGNVDASAGIALLEIRGQTVVNEGGHAHGVANPHYWLDPENAYVITTGIAEALMRLAPNEADRITANRERFRIELDARIRQWSAALAPYAGAKLIAYHNSWPYFARRFRLDIVDFVEPKPGVSPSPAHLARLIAAGRKAQVRAILHEPYEPDDTSRLLAQKLNVPFVLLATSVGSVSGVTNYLALLDHNVATLVRALSTAMQ